MAGRPPRALEIDVLKTALEVFCNQGPETPLKVIGDRVGVTASAISQRFGSKRELINRALETATLCPKSTLKQVHGLEFPDALARVGGNFAAYLVDHVIPAIDLAKKLGQDEYGQSSSLSTEPAVQAFIEAALQLIPSGSKARPEAPRLFRAYLATLVGQYQLSQRNLDATSKNQPTAKELAQDFTPLLMEPSSHNGATK